jgi:8-oxo-dGTP diphosphatase
MKHIAVVAAVIRKGEKILCVQRKESKYDYISLKWEFPGGKVEEGESNEEAIVREIEEELALSITIDREFVTVDHQYPDFQLTMYSFMCQTQNDSPELREHKNFKWLNADDLNTLDWAAADVPIVERLMEQYHAE